jgi:hypothetical protein
MLQEEESVNLAGQLKQFMWVMFGCGLLAKLTPTFFGRLVWHRTSSARSFGSGVRYHKYAAKAKTTAVSDKRM